MKRGGIGLAVAIFALSAPYVSADASSFHLRYRTWTTEEGLPQGSVRDIAQTPDGYLWFATSDGLVRFDGVRMVVYSRTDHPQMTSNRILGLYVDHDGTLWIGTQDGGLLEKHGETFRVHDRASGMPDQEIRGLGQDDAGVLWVGTPSGMVVRENGRWVKPAVGRPPPAYWGSFLGIPCPETPAAMRQEQRHPVWGSREGRVWVLNDGVLHVRENGTWRMASSGVPAIALPHTRRVFEDAEGTIWIGSESGLVQAIPTPISAILPESFGPRFWRNVFTLAEDATGRVWVGNDSIPWRFDHGKAEILWHQPWWPNAWITMLAPDGEGGIFGGSNPGLFRIRPGRPAEKLRDGPTVMDVHRDRAGTLWVATPHGLFRSAGTGWERVHVPVSEDVKVLLESRDGAMWVATYARLARWA